MRSSRIGTAVAAGFIVLAAPLAAVAGTCHHTSTATVVRADARPATAAPAGSTTPADPQDVTWGP